MVGGEQRFRNGEEGFRITEVGHDFTGDTTEEEYEDEDDQSRCNNGDDGVDNLSTGRLTLMLNWKTARKASMRRKMPGCRILRR